MEQTDRGRMPVRERAKQFAPFSPLNGLYTALSQAEARLSYSQSSLLSERELWEQEQARERDTGSDDK